MIHLTLLFVIASISTLYVDACIRACENNKLSITCPEGTEIRINKAWYGRQDANICGSSSVTNCYAEATPKVQSICNHRGSCVVPACNDFIGYDPCVGTYKYLEVEHECVPCGALRRKTACENSNLEIHCPADQKIFVVDAFYGRLQKDGPCAVNNDQDFGCFRDATGKVADTCNGKCSCSIGASNDVFGDPCVDTWKYLEANYKCI